MFRVLCLFSLLINIFSAQAESVSATINITGRITATPCVVDTNTISQVVNLGKAFAHNLVPGTGGDWVPFQLTLSKCPVGTSNSTVTFMGTAASDDNYFANSGSATGVVLQISDSSHINSYGNGDTITQSVDAGRNVKFPLEARMYNLDGEVKGGGFNAVVQVDFTYQ